MLGKIGQHLNTLDGNEVVDAFTRGEEISFEIVGTAVTLTKDDVLTSPMQKPGFTALEDRGVTVALDTALSEDLIREGYAREVISKIQTMRKEAGFEVTDRIGIAYSADDKLAEAIEDCADMIRKGTLAVSLTRKDTDDSWIRKEWDINDRKAVLSVKKVTE